MNILLVYPRYPDTFWSFRYSLKFIHKKSSFPPLGLLTVAAMLPESWSVRLVDMNVSPLTERVLAWADYVFLSAMTVQQESVRQVIAQCNAADVKIVAGGPLFTTGHDRFTDIDHFVLNEAEITLPVFIEDVGRNDVKPLYASSEWADVTTTPIPRWDLIKMNRYSAMSIQYSRGCPFDCDFCDIPVLYGHKPRIKTQNQVIQELEALYESGWRHSVFFVDDNFIGNKKKLKQEILPAITAWRRENKYPFSFLTQVSMELADDDTLMDAMVEAGFNRVFVGIETPHDESLIECSKYQNSNRDMVASIKKMQRAGLLVEGGFIVGFDGDPLSIFETQIRFIQETGVVTAMVGLLNVLPNTKLYYRLNAQKRIITHMSGNNTDCTINFIPKMSKETLINGYKRLMRTLYSPKYYYARVITLLKEYRHRQRKKLQFRLSHIGAFAKSVIRLGIFGKERYYYWQLIVWTLFRKPRLLGFTIGYAINGFHFRQIAKRYHQHNASCSTNVY
ncbi:B12-binding domain-containing radical SAM protein [candidate division WOR-3 bacterium]|nr:B12-binding domain-containing radical SAM protein [candidate division WOR-3 bacterium]